jgi:restriction system protein
MESVKNNALDFVFEVKNLIQTYPTQALIILLGVVVFYFILFGKSREKWRVDKSKYLLKDLKKINDPAHIFTRLRRLDPFLYEELILTSIDKHNPHVKITRNKRYTGDGGIDGVIKLNGVKIAIQAKCYTNEIVTSDIFKLQTDMTKVGASYGLFVHTGKTRPVTWLKTKDSKVFIVSGASMIALLLRGELPLELLKCCNMQPNG